jgi:tight adherence protein C
MGLNGIGALGALLGLAMSVGLILVVQRVRAITRPSLATRTLASLGIDDATEGSGDPLRLLMSLVPTRRSLAGTPSVQRLVWAGSGVGGGALIAAIATSRGDSALLLLVLPLLGGVVGVLAERQARSRRATRVRSHVAQQLPGAAELLAFSVAAGESIVPALARVGRATGGELGLALRECVADVRTGETLDVALRRVATATRSPEVERFVDRITISLERGTPLAEVLRAQAADARAHQRNALIEVAGRKDVAMLIPVVFLILPTVVLIALFPGMRALTQIAG